MSSIKNRLLINRIKNGANLMFQQSNPKYVKNDELKLAASNRQDRKLSHNKTNSIQNIAISQSLKRSQNTQQSHLTNNTNNPWVRTTKLQQLSQNSSIQQPQTTDDHIKSNKLRNQQALPQLNQSPQKSTAKYVIIDNSDKKNEYYSGQQYSQQIFDKVNNETNSKILNSSKTIKPGLKSMMNEKNQSSKENLYEINKRESQLPQIPKSTVQPDIFHQKQADNITFIKSNQNKAAYFNSEYQQKQNDYLESSKENQIEFRSNDLLNNMKQKNTSLSSNSKFAFSTTPPNNTNLQKQVEDKMQISKELKLKQNSSNNQVQSNNVKDILEEKFEKIFESSKSIGVTQNNAQLPPKIQKKEIEEKENIKFESKERTTLQDENVNNFQSKLQKTENTASYNKIPPSETPKPDIQNSNSNIEGRQSIQPKSKIVQPSTNSLQRYYKYDFDFSKFNFAFSKRSSAGLNNIGNTCFMNSALQCVFNTPVFNEFFFSGVFERDINPKNKGVAQSYSALIKQVRSTGSSSSQAPYSLKKSIERVSSQFYGTDQQDAQELLRCLLDGLHEDLNRVRTKPKYRELEADTNKRSLQEISDDWYQYYKGRDDSIVTDFFSGQLLSKVICSKCKNESLAFDNFMDLSLSFSRGQENEADLVDLLKAFLKEENLDDDYYCSKCKARTKSRRQFELYKLPQILVIHLKRFNFGRSYRNKISSNVSFPVSDFDVSQFIQSSTDSSVQNSKYELFGIVNHSGSLSGGHYTSESLNTYEGKWYNYNDSHAGSISQESINRYQNSGRSSPYLLFYCKSELLLPYQNNSSIDLYKMKSNL